MGGGMSFSKSSGSSGPKDVTPGEYAWLRSPSSKALSTMIGAKWQQDPETGDWSQSKYKLPKFKKKDWGQYVAQMSEQERQALRESAMFSDPEGMYGLGPTIRGEYLDPESNPFLGRYTEAMNRDILEAYDLEKREREMLFARAGHTLPESSPFAVQQGLSWQRSAQAIADTTGEIYYQNYQWARQNQLAAIETQWGMVLDNLSAQALPRLIEQFGITEGTRQNEHRRQEILNALALAVDASLQFGQESSSHSFAWGASGGASSSPSTTENQ